MYYCKEMTLIFSFLIMGCFGVLLYKHRQSLWDQCVNTWLWLASTGNNSSLLFFLSSKHRALDACPYTRFTLNKGNCCLQFGSNCCMLRILMLSGDELPPSTPETLLWVWKYTVPQHNQWINYCEARSVSSGLNASNETIYWLIAVWLNSMTGGAGLLTQNTVCFYVYFPVCFVTCLCISHCPTLLASAAGTCEKGEE